MVPIILIFFRFDLKRSIALSNSTIFVSACVRYLVNLNKKHPSQLKLVLVDPKKVELTLFNKVVRHFLAKLPDSEEPIITFDICRYTVE